MKDLRHIINEAVAQRASVIDKRLDKIHGDLQRVDCPILRREYKKEINFYHDLLEEYKAFLPSDYLNKIPGGTENESQDFGDHLEEAKGDDFKKVFADFQASRTSPTA